MKKSLLVLILCMLALQGDVVENQDVPTQLLAHSSTPQENFIDSRIFVGFGLGYVLTHTNPNREILDFNAREAHFIFGGEWIFHKSGNGLNISVDASLPQNLSFAARYIYETPNTSWKYAVLSGLSIGPIGGETWDKDKILKDGTSIQWVNWVNKVFMNYELGLRLRKNRHAVLLNVKVPLFSNDVNITYEYKVWLSSSRWDYIYRYEDVKQKTYPFVFSLSYIYFFGL